MKLRLAKSIVCCLLVGAMGVFCALPAFAKSDSTAIPYSYTYDPWGDPRESPNPFAPNAMITGSSMGIGNFSNPQDICVQGNLVYIADTGNNRIVVCDGDWNLIRIIDSFASGGETDTFRGPCGVFVTPGGDIYVADTDNQRIVHMDENLSAVKIITKPDDAMMEGVAEFLPLKIEVDEAERIFLLARNVNKGIMVFTEDGAFSGYIGANKVRYNLIDLIWKRVFSTRAQREQMAAFVPTEFSNIALDAQGFLYTTCDNLGDNDIMNLINAAEENWFASLFGLDTASDVQPVKRLNAMGADVLIRNGWLPPIGDWEWSDVGSFIRGPSKFVDVVPAENDSYFTLDRVRGRVFAYDFQGNLLYVFGGYGSKLGYFIQPVAIDLLDSRLLVLDSRSAGLTEFVPTRYGTLINDALSEYKIGNYDVSAALWEEVLVLNINYDLAYIGIGRSLLRQERYEEAMEYFKLKYDFDNYSKAFEQHRRQVVERNIPYIVVGIIALIVFSGIFKRRHWIKKAYLWVRNKNAPKESGT